MPQFRATPLVSRSVALLFGLGIALVGFLLVVPLFPLQQQLKEGNIAPRTLEARHDATFESAGATEAARNLAAERVPEVPLPLDPAIRQAQVTKADRFLEQVRSLRQRTDINDPQQRLDQFNTLPGASDVSTTGRTALLSLDTARFDALQQRVDTAINELMSKTLQKTEISQRIDEYLATPGKLPEQTTPTELSAIRELLKTFVVSNFQVDTQATQRNRQAARDNVAPIIKTYSRGQVIVAEGDRLSAEAIEALKATGVIDGSFDLHDMAGGSLFALCIGALLAAYTYRFQPFPKPPYRRMALVGISFLGVLAAVRLAIPAITPDTDHHFLAFALPVAAAAMITAAFADLTFAAVVAVLAAIFATFIAATLPQLAGASFIDSLEALEMVTAWTAAGLAGATAVYRAERLSRYAFAAFLATLASGAVMLVFWLISTPRTNTELGWIAAVSAISGFGSTVIALGVFVLLSLALGVTTRLQLMELAQADHPLLRRLQDEAPGTYHHSMMVGALAERGAALIGADALLARVGSYYHDVGKLARPGAYIENMIDASQSPHDALPPEESARIIREHVTNGIEIGKRYRLPAIVRDFIPEHHGTRLVTYFYRRAAKDGANIDAEAFRYAGPRPQSREAAIVMLADSCEAVVRARGETTRKAIDSLVDGVFAERLAEGQLDECDITMRDLQSVASTFKSTLRAVYHPRVAYPDPTPEELASLAHGETTAEALREAASE